jgi:hypothetical protein
MMDAFEEIDDISLQKNPCSPFHVLALHPLDLEPVERGRQLLGRQRDHPVPLHTDSSSQEHTTGFPTVRFTGY